MYRETRPASALEPFVECVWTLAPCADGSVRTHPVVPDGRLDLVWSRSQGAIALGPASAFRSVPVHDTISGIRFRPGVAGAFLGVSAREIRDQAVALAVVWGRKGEELEERLLAVNDAERALQLLQAALMARLENEFRLDRAVLEAASRLQRSAASPVRDIAVWTGLSERQLRRRFEREVGLGMRQFGRIVRFQRLLDGVREHRRRGGGLSPDWAGMAFEFGYADRLTLFAKAARSPA